jgi:putative DNA primase/helicase
MNRADYDAMVAPLDEFIARQDSRMAATSPAPAVPDAWPAPTPLPDALPPVQAFGADLLPIALRGWVMDIAHRMQCPPDFPAVGALVSLSSLIGARAVIQPKVRDDWRVVPNLWGMAVGRVGVKKSPALSEALTPLNRLQADEFERHQAAQDAWAIDCKVSAMQDADNEKKARGLASNDPAAARALLALAALPAEPSVRRFIVNDATVEKLGELMKENPWGILSYRDELYGLLTSLDKQGQEGARTFMLQSYDGNQGYVFDRIQRGTIHIPRVCQAVIGGIQPGRIQEYVRGAVAGGSADDGLLQRFALAVWPDIGGEYVHVDQLPDTPAKKAAWAVFKRLAALQSASDTEPTVWRFDDAAQALFVEWLIPFENEIRGDELHPAMVSHLAKYRKVIPALALVFALVDTPSSAGLIHEPELLRALAWGDYLRTHANRLYAAAVTPETTGAAALLAKIRAGKIEDGFKIKDVKQKGWSGLTTTDEVRKAAAMLADYDWLRCDVVAPGAAGGRPSETFRIHPSLRGDEK